MKIRKGFVSNSSSSSFVCEVSGTIESGWDMCLSDADMSECENGHTFSNSYSVYEDLNELPDEIKIKLVAEEACPIDYSIDNEDRKEMYKLMDENRKRRIEIYLKKHSKEDILEAFDNDEIDEDIRNGYNVPSEMCPLCQFTEISNFDAKNYMFTILKINDKTLKEEISNRFKNYKEFQDFLT